MTTIQEGAPRRAWINSEKDQPDLHVPGRRASLSRGFFGRAWLAFGGDRLSVSALCVLAIIGLLTAFAPWIADSILHTSPEQMMRDPSGRFAMLKPPGPGYLLGTDDLGRDTLTRLLFAGRVSLSIAFLVAAVSIVVGSLAGMVAGFFGGWVDDVVNAMVQFVFSIPSLFVLILLSLIFRPDVLVLSLIFGFFYWPATARQVRGVVQSVRNLDYVYAARVLGASNARIMARTFCRMWRISSWWSPVSMWLVRFWANRR